MSQVSSTSTPTQPPVVNNFSPSNPSLNQGPPTQPHSLPIGGPMGNRAFPPYQPYGYPTQLPTAQSTPKRPQYHLMIRNLPANVQDEFLYTEIKNICHVKSFKIPRKPNNENRGMCFIEIWSPPNQAGPTQTDLTLIKTNLRKLEIFETKLNVVNFADKETLKKIEEEFNFHIDKAPYDVTEEELENYFTRYGDVFSCDLKKSESKKNNEKYSFGHVSFMNQASVTKFKSELIATPEQKYKLKFRPTPDGQDVDHIEISDFKKKEERSHTITIYANLDKNKDIANYLSAYKLSIIDNSKQGAASKNEQSFVVFKKHVSVILEQFIEDFNKKVPEREKLELSKIEIYYDGVHNHCYAYITFKKGPESGSGVGTNSVDIEAVADRFAGELDRKSIYATINTSNPKSKSEGEASTVIKISGIQDESKATLDTFETQLKSVFAKVFTVENGSNQVPDIKSMDFKILRTDNRYVKHLNVITTDLSESEKKKLKEALELKENNNDLWTTVAVKTRTAQSTNRQYCVFIPSINSNFEIDHASSIIDKIESHIKSNKPQVGEESQVEESPELSGLLEVKKFTMIKKSKKTGKDTTTKQFQNVCLIDLYSKTSFNKILRDYKILFETFRPIITGQDQNSYIIMPYNKLEDIKDYKNFAKVPGVGGNRSASVSDTKSNSSSSNLVPNSNQTPIIAPGANNYLNTMNNWMPFNPRMHPTFQNQFNQSGIPNQGGQPFMPHHGFNNPQRGGTYQNRDYNNRTHSGGPNNYIQNKQYYNQNQRHPNGNYYGNQSANPNSGPRNNLNVAHSAPVHAPTIPVHNPTTIIYDNVNVIESNMDTFNSLGNDQKRTYLGKLVHNEVDRNITSPADQQYVPRITGMLIDLNVFTIEDIIQLLKDPQELTDRIEEAKNLIQQDTNKSN